MPVTAQQKNQKLTAEQKAIIENLVNEQTQKLVDGFVQVPIDKMIQQILYLQEQALPKALEKYGAENENYKFYKGLVDTLMWATYVVERAAWWKNEWQQQRLALEFFRNEAIRYRNELQKYQFTEDTLLLQEDFNQAQQRVAKRMEDILSGKDDLRTHNIH